MLTFTLRLRRAAAMSHLNPSDLSRWFDRPRTTVDTWLAGRTPLGREGQRAEDDLARLEWSLKHFPIPAEYSWAARAVYLVEKRDAAIRNCRVSALRAAE